MSLTRPLCIAFVLGSVGFGAGPTVADGSTCPGACETRVLYSIDSTFDASEARYIEDGTRVWREGTGGRVCFQQVAEGSETLRFIRLEHQKDLAPFDDEWQNHVALNKGGRIWIVPSKVDDPGEYVALIIHEVGHHLGLGHIEDTQATYMHGTINDTPRAMWKHPALPERDRREYCAVRGCVCAW